MARPIVHPRGFCVARFWGAATTPGYTDAESGRELTSGSSAYPTEEGMPFTHAAVRTTPM